KGMVPSMTETSLWHSPALTIRTRTSCGSGPRTSTSSRTSSCPVHTIPFIGLGLRPSSRPSSRPHDRLELAVRVEPEPAPVPADAGEFDPAERRLRVLLRGVDGDRARAELAGHPHAAGAVPGEHVVVEAVVGPVGQGHAL